MTNKSKGPSMSIEPTVANYLLICAGILITGALVSAGYAAYLGWRDARWERRLNAGSLADLRAAVVDMRRREGWLVEDAEGNAITLDEWLEMEAER